MRLGLPVVCECISDSPLTFTGACCGPTCKADGIILVQVDNGSGMAFVEPLSATASWELQLGLPLLSSHSKYLYLI